MSLADLSQHVVATTNRLRLLQIDLADETPESRGQYLSDEIERALAKVLPEHREMFLEQLKESFPTWEGGTSTRAGDSVAETATRSSTDERELNDPSFLVSRLIELAPTLSERERQVLMDRLQAAGLAAIGTYDWPEYAVQPLVETGISKAGEVDAGRALETLEMLAKLVISLDQLIWNTWKALAPRSQMRRTGDLKQSMRKFLDGDPQTPRGQVDEDLERCRRLVASLVSALHNSGRQFSQQFCGKFAPAEIEALANMEGGGILVSKEVKCWRKYTELAGSLDPVEIEAELLQSIADYAESLMRGIGR